MREDIRRINQEYTAKVLVRDGKHDNNLSFLPGSLEASMQQETLLQIL